MYVLAYSYRVSSSCRNMKASSTAPVDPTVISNVQDPTISAKISDQEIIVGGTMDYESELGSYKYICCYIHVC